MPSTEASERASSFVATADTAAVRISVMSRPSIVARGLAGLGPEEQNHRVVARDALIVRIERDQLGSERAGVGGHQAEKSLVIGDRHHHARRLHYLAGGKIGHGSRHSRDQILHLQEIVDRLLVENDQRLNQCLSSIPCPSGSRISALAYSPSRTNGPHVIGTPLVFR